VPGAVNRPFALNVLDGHLRDAQELRAELQGVIGNRDPQQVVLMCGSGVTACHLLLAMESGPERRAHLRRLLERLGQRQQPPGGDRRLSAGSDPFSNGKRF
jgi:hypothetical protein